MRRDFLRRTATRAGRTPSVLNALVASFERVSEVRLAYVEYCFSTRPVRVSHIRYSVTALLRVKKEKKKDKVIPLYPSFAI